jgi:hypothetical protein
VKSTTEKGQVYAVSLARDRGQLEHQHELRQARVLGVPPEAASKPDSVEPNPLVTTISEVVDEDEVGFPRPIANLIICEQAHLIIHSDTHRNPLMPNYDLKIPPNTYDKAMHKPDCDHWLSAMRKEMKNLMSEMNIYELVPLPPGCKAIDCHWVLKFKEDLKGAQVQGTSCRARFLTSPGVDFGKTFTPVAKSASICILCAVAALSDWKLNCFTKHAFLWGKLCKDVYMH